MKPRDITLSGDIRIHKPAEAELHYGIVRPQLGASQLEAELKHVDNILDVNAFNKDSYYEIWQKVALPPTLGEDPDAALARGVFATKRFVDSFELQFVRSVSVTRRGQLVFEFTIDNIPADPVDFANRLSGTVYEQLDEDPEVFAKAVDGSVEGCMIVAATDRVQDDKGSVTDLLCELESTA